MSHFKIVGLFTIFIVSSFYSFEPLRAETYVQNEISLKEIVAEAPNLNACDTENWTAWDWELENILEKYQTYLRESKNPYHPTQWLNHLREMVSHNVYRLLLQRDAFEDTELFFELYDQAVMKIVNNIPPLNIEHDEPYKNRWIEQKKWASDLLKANRSLLNEIKNLKSDYPKIPYGRNFCNQPSNSSNEITPKILSECFVNQESFRESVKFDRKNELYCNREPGQKICPPIIHGVKASSLEPCGKVIGTWQATANGNLISNKLKIIPQNQLTPVSFDSNVLIEIIKSIDQDLKLK